MKENASRESISRRRNPYLPASLGSFSEGSDQQISSPIILSQDAKTIVQRAASAGWVLAEATVVLLKMASEHGSDPFGACAAVGLVGTLLEQVILAQVNRKQLQRLASRTLEISPFLRRIRETRSKQNVAAALTSFENVVKECIEQARKYGKRNYAIRVLRAGTDQDKFTDLNKRLNEAMSQLGFGLGIEMTVMLEQGLKDSLADKRDIINCISHVSESQKQSLESSIEFKNQQQQFMLSTQEQNAILISQVQSLLAMMERKEKLLLLECKKYGSTIDVDFKDHKALKAPTLPIDSKLLIPFHEIDIHKNIAQGSFGSIYLGTWNDKPVVVKKVCEFSSKKEDYEQFVREVQIMALLNNASNNHHYVTHLYGACLEPDACLVMEYMEKRSLDILIDQKALSDNDKINLSLDIAKSLEYIHKQKILHRDIKTANILIDAQCHAKITDFGLSKTSDVNIKSTNELSEDIQWMAPEVLLNNNAYHVQSDIYSYGMILWSLWTGKKPFEGLTKEEVKRKIINNEHEEITENIPFEFRFLINKCWSVSIKDRPTLSEITKILDCKLSTEELRELAEISEALEDFDFAAIYYHLADKQEVSKPKIRQSKLHVQDNKALAMEIKDDIKNIVVETKSKEKKISEEDYLQGGIKKAVKIVEDVQNSFVATFSTRKLPTIPKRYIALYDYTAKNDKELSFKERDILTILDKAGNWFLGELNGETGAVPSNYLEAYVGPKSQISKKNSYRNSLGFFSPHEKIALEAISSEMKDFANIIGGYHIINQKMGAVSLVRKSQADHAYLIIETIDEKNNHILKDVHLVKCKTNSKKADIIHRGISNKPASYIEDIETIRTGCSSITWNIDLSQIKKLDDLIESEKKRAVSGKINYTNNPLDKNGYNCLTWAYYVLDTLGLKCKTDYLMFPKQQIKGTHIGEEMNNVNEKKNSKELKRETKIEAKKEMAKIKEKEKETDLERETEIGNEEPNSYIPGIKLLKKWQ